MLRSEIVPLREDITWLGETREAGRRKAPQKQASELARRLPCGRNRGPEYRPRSAGPEATTSTILADRDRSRNTGDGARSALERPESRGDASLRRLRQVEKLVEPGEVEFGRRGLRESKERSRKRTQLKAVRLMTETSRLICSGPQPIGW